MPETRRSALLTTIALLFVVAPGVLGLSVIALFFSGWVGLTIPVFAAAAVYLYQLAIRSAVSYEGRVVAREVGAVVLALVAGIGTWVGAIVVGILTGLMPLFAEVQGYPYADAWNVGSVVLAVLVVPVTWWLLRRLADPRR